MFEGRAVSKAFHLFVETYNQQVCKKISEMNSMDIRTGIIQQESDAIRGKR